MQWPHAVASCGGLMQWLHAVASCGGLMQRPHAVDSCGGLMQWPRAVAFQSWNHFKRLDRTTCSHLEKTTSCRKLLLWWGKSS